MNVLMVGSEATPFAKTGGLADVLGGLPPALAARGENVAVVIPDYRENVYPTPPTVAYRNLWIPIGPGFMTDIYQTTERGVTYYFVHCPALFDRPGIYSAAGSDYPDNHLRFAVLSMAALDIARYLFSPNIIHAHDWQAALTPVYLREHFGADPTFIGIKTLFTIHNLGYQGIFAAQALQQIGLSPRLFNPEQLEFFGDLNLLKGGIGFADAVSTVSKGYAKEIQTPEYGFGLDGFLAKRAPIYGIVNGVDYEEWSPERDHYIARKYSVTDLSGKRDCKRDLLAEFGFPADLDRPIIGIVSRFASQKGFDLIADVASDLMKEDVSLAVLGSGEPHYETMFRDLAAAYPHKVGLRQGFDNPLGHRIEAGADMFLMPSKYEPCGLSQIYSLRYGTVPVVRATGGLDDTIDKETGFKFQDYSGTALLEALRSALTVYRQRSNWLSMMQRGMRRDFSWSTAAVEYIALYQRLLAA
ncbi:MAG TPA: glycogen synthase GlgA [Bryobacteraceae bacterium]|nr:glycogen synthase GlgA [Bryobacteraceae bacterium]